MMDMLLLDLDIRMISFLVALFLIFGIAIYHLIIYASTRHQGRNIGGALTNVFVVLALILLSKNGSIFMFQWTGLPNVGWYLGYIMGAFGCYFFAQLGYLTDVHPYGPKIHRVLRFALTSLLLGLSLIYLFHLIHRSEWPARTPRTGWELLFATSYYVYCTGAVFAVGLTGWIAIPREENPAQRLRLWVSLSGIGATMLCFVGRVLYLSTYYFYADLIWIDKIALVALAAAVLCFCFSIAPGWIFRLLVSYNPKVYLRQLWHLFWLRRLSAQVSMLMPALVMQRSRLPQQLRHTRLSIYQTLIAILDAQKELAGCLNMEPERRQRITGLVWSEDQHQQAADLFIALQQIDRLVDAAFPDLVLEVVRISQQTTKPSVI